MKNYGGYSPKSEKTTYNGKPLIGLKLDVLNFIGHNKVDWEFSYKGWWLTYQGKRVFVPLFSSDKDILYGFAIFNLKTKFRPGKDVSDIMKEISNLIAERIRLSVQNIKFTGVLKDIVVTISGGIAYREPKETLENFLDRADKALYESKETGRNKITIYPK